MNFLNPSLLFGLFAVSIPILIHLLNLRKIKKVEFSTLMFLKEIQKSKMRRIKLKQIILLALRVMAIVFLVLCFANPVYEGYAGNNDNFSGYTTLIFIDDSFSMAARDSKGQYLAQAKDAVKKILESHKESDDIYLIPASKTDFKGNKVLFDSFTELYDSLEKISISYKPADINEIISFSDKILKNSAKPNKEIFIISDFSQINFNPDNGLTPAISETKDNSVNAYLIKIGNREINNLSIDSFVVTSKIIEKNKDVKIKVFINNHSRYNVYNKTVNLIIDNELKGERVIDVSSFDKKEIEFSFKSDHSGNVNGIVEITQSEFQDEEIIQDNKYYFSLYIPESFNIGVIYEKPEDFYFIDLALRTAGSILSDSIKMKSNLFNVTSERTVTESILKNSVLFISGKNSFTDYESQILRDFVSDGGGLFIFPGNSIDINNYNSTILNKLNFVKIENMNSNKEENNKLKFDKVDFENPVLSEIFLNRNLNSTSGNFNIDSPEINSFFSLLPNEKARQIITLTNNRPFLVESKLSKGKVIISSVSARDDQSDLPLKTIFVPLIIRSIYYLSNNFEYQKEYIAGKSNLISVREIKNINDMVLPDKSDIKPELDLINPNENYLYLPYSDLTSGTGFYSLKDSSGAEFDFALNKNSIESNMTVSENDDITDYFKKNGIQNVKLIEKSDDILSAVEESSSGLSLWKYFLIGALLFIAGELFLSKKLEKS